MSTAEPMTYTSEPPAGGRSRTVLLIVLAAVAALVIGGGAFAVARMLGGGGDRPAAAMPAGTTAYLQVDIDPAAGQKLAALDVLSEWEPELMDAASDGDLKRELFELIQADSEELSGLSYEEDIEPWLGDRAGVGVVSVAGADEPVPLLAIQITDTAAAEDALAEVGDESVGWYVSGDYVVVLPAEHRDTVLADVEAGTLAASESFTEDLEELGDQGVMTGWFDMAALNAMATSQLGEDASGEFEDAMGPGWMGDNGGLTELSQGRVAMTVRFADQGIEIAALSRDAGLEGLEDTDTAHLVGELPADTFVAMGVEHGDQLVDYVWKQMEELAPDEVASAQEEAAAAGFELPADLKVLVGDSLAVSADDGIVDVFLEGDESVAELPVAYRVNTDTTRAQELIDEAFTADGMSAQDAGVVTRSDDGVLTVGGSQSYVDTLVSGGDTLADVDLYDRAVAGADDADFVFYVNLNSVEDRYLDLIEDQDDRDAVALLAAVGMSSTLEEDGDSRFTMRIVTD